MIEKVLYNMLSDTAGLVIRSTTNAVTLYPPNDKIVDNSHATNGLLYYSISNFDTTSPSSGYETAGAQLELYQSFDGSNWYLNTAISRVTTADSGAVKLDNLGRILRLGYVTAASAVSVMSILELYEER